VIQESDVEGRIVDDQLGPLDVPDKGIRYLGKARLVGQKGIGDAVHINRARLDLTIRLEVVMEVVSGQSTVDKLYTADLDDPMTILRVETGGLGVEHDLAHLNPVLDDL
jgi:hypothetical protein